MRIKAGNKYLDRKNRVVEITEQLAHKINGYSFTGQDDYGFVVYYTAKGDFGTPGTPDEHDLVAEYNDPPLVVPPARTTSIGLAAGTNNSLQLEIGKSYRTRDGRRAEVTNVAEVCDQYGHSALGFLHGDDHTEPCVLGWTADRFYNPTKVSHVWDLVAAWDLPAEVAPVPNATQDDGTRRTFSTGYQRDTGKDKGRFDLLSQAYYGNLRVAQLFARGAERYGAANWLKGAPLSVYADCMNRHAQKAAAGWDDEDHTSACAWNALCLMHTQELIKQGKLPKELDDLPKYEVPK